MDIRFIDRQTGEIKSESPPAEGLLKFLYGHPFGKTAILSIAKRKFISTWYGRIMDQPSSSKRIQDFIDQHQIDMTTAQKPVSDFTSFNDFFHRKLKPEARPIGHGFVSPGDGRLLAFEEVSELHHFFIKGQKFTLPAFLKDHKLARQFEKASMIILRLAPNDYHRFHFPYDGVPGAPKKIKGYYYSVSPYAITANFTRVFCENKREYCILKTPDKGDMLIAPIGATMVGSIIETYTPGKTINKGDEMGYFAFGGSTVVVLVDRNKLTIDADLLANTKNNMETFVRMGESIGT
jgi:phosphatidylserine decarboxylase